MADHLPDCYITTAPDDDEVGCICEPLRAKAQKYLTDGSRAPLDNLRKAVSGALADALLGLVEQAMSDAYARGRADERAKANEPLHSLTEVARLRGVSRQRVQQMVASGELPAIRIGNTWAVRASDATP